MPTLKEISIEVTNLCHLKCIHCSSEAGTPLKNELSLTEIKGIIGQSKQLGATILTLSGGEPLLHPNIEEIIEYSKGMEIRLQTSGNEPIIKLPETAKVIYSVHGLEETHEKVTGVKGSYQRTLENIRKTKAAGTRAEAHVVATSLNFRQIPALEQILQIPIHLLRLVEQGRATKDLQLTKAQFKELQEILAAHPTIIAGGSIDRQYWSGGECRTSCQIGHDKILLRADGEVTYCAALKESPAGNIRDNPLDYFWNSHPFILAIRDFAGNGFKNIKGKCKKCDILDDCKGGCIAQRLHKYNDLFRGPDPLCYRKQ